MYQGSDKAEGAQNSRHVKANLGEEDTDGEKKKESIRKKIWGIGAVSNELVLKWSAAVGELG